MLKQKNNALWRVDFYSVSFSIKFCKLNVNIVCKLFTKQIVNTKKTIIFVAYYF